MSRMIWRRRHGGDVTPDHRSYPEGSAQTSASALARPSLRRGCTPPGQELLARIGHDGAGRLTRTARHRRFQFDDAGTGIIRGRTDAPGSPGAAHEGLDGRNGCSAYGTLLKSGAARQRGSSSMVRRPASGYCRWVNYPTAGVGRTTLALRGRRKQTRPKRSLTSESQPGIPCAGYRSH